MELNPDNPQIAGAAAATAWQAGDKNKYDQYRKDARHLGLPGEWDMMLELMKEINALSPHRDTMKYLDMDVPSLNAAIARNPNNVDAYLVRGSIYFAKGDDGKAISDLNAAIRLDPGNAPAYLLRGIVYGYTHRYDRAIVDLTEAIRLNPDSEMAHYHRGDRLRRARRLRPCHFRLQ